MHTYVVTAYETEELLGFVQTNAGRDDFDRIASAAAPVTDHISRYSCCRKIAGMLAANGFEAKTVDFPQYDIHEGWV